MKITVVAAIICVICIIVCVIIVLSYRRKCEKTMLKIDKMLDMAIDGSFSEMIFDESLMSALETKLANYLASSQLSSRRIKEEKDKINEMISDISHQTKTPISNILLYSQLFSEEKLGEKELGYVKALNEQAEKLSFLIMSLVKSSRLETGIINLLPQRSSVDSMIDAAIAQISAKANDKNIKIIYEKSNEYALFDEKWTIEALYNILDNAVKYTDKNGKIKININAFEMFCCINVEDNGMGIDESEQAEIFTRFYRCESVRRFPGVGIGLYLTRKIINGQDGYIKLKSKLNEGSSFSIYLPM